MSTTESLDRPPLEEIAKRTGEAGAGLVAAVHAAAVHEHVHAQVAYARRVADAHADGRRALESTESDEVSQTPEDESMGNIIVTGDLYGDAALNALRAQVESPPPAEPSTPEPPPVPEVVTKTEPQGMSALAKVAVMLGAAALIPGIGIPLAAMFGAFDKPPITVTTPFVDTDTDIFPSVIIERPTTPQSEE